MKECSRFWFKIGFYYGNKTWWVSDLEEWRWWQGETIWSRLSDQRQGSRGIQSKAGIEIDISKGGGLSFWLCFVLKFKDQQVHTFSEHKKDIQLTCSYIQWLENMSYDEHVFISVLKSTLIFLVDIKTVLIQFYHHLKNNNKKRLKRTKFLKIFVIQWYFTISWGGGTKLHHCLLIFGEKITFVCQINVMLVWPKYRIHMKYNLTSLWQGRFSLDCKMSCAATP